MNKKKKTIRIVSIVSIMIIVLTICIGAILTKEKIEAKYSSVKTIESNASTASKIKREMNMMNDISVGHLLKIESTETIGDVTNKNIRFNVRATELNIETELDIETLIDFFIRNFGQEQTQIIIDKIEAGEIVSLESFPTIKTFIIKLKNTDGSNYKNIDLSSNISSNALNYTFEVDKNCILEFESKISVRTEFYNEDGGIALDVSWDDLYSAERFLTINQIDKTAPTVTITTDKSTYKPGETAVITSTFSEVVNDGTPKIAMSGVSNLNKTAMTKVSETQYRYNYVVPQGDGTQTITISDASDLATNVMVNSTKTFNISTPKITAIRVTTEPSKKTYIEGQNFNGAGMKVTATYSDGTTKEVTGYTITDGNNLTAGKTSVTISYTENGVTKTVTQGITVSAKTLSSIRVTTEPSNKTYIEGQNFNAAGMKITATYSDGTTKEVTGYTITDGNNLSAGKTSVTISYTENGVTKTVTQGITVSAKEISSIRVTTEPSKKAYIEGQNFNGAGMKITATYSDGTTKEVTGYTITDGNNLSAGKTSVIISYTENGVTKTVTQSITVKKKEVPTNTITENTTTENTTTENTTIENTTTENITTENTTTENTTTENTTTENTTTENTITENTTTENITIENTTTENIITENTTIENTTKENITIDDKNKEDTTTADKKIPQTGEDIILVTIGLVVITAFGVSYICWKKYKDI